MITTMAQAEATKTPPAEVMAQAEVCKAATTMTLQVTAQEEAFPLTAPATKTLPILMAQAEVATTTAQEEEATTTQNLIAPAIKMTPATKTPPILMAPATTMTLQVTAQEEATTAPARILMALEEEARKATRTIAQEEETTQEETTQEETTPVILTGQTTNRPTVDLEILDLVTTQSMPLSNMQRMPVLTPTLQRVLQMALTSSAEENSEFKMGT